ncbi:hypothetical protein V5799_021060 [Amblyomma americanum]|uniref:Uncharacterized protein n=1 Tax=Amblyomma americanum TaxID=6943 RepID=A0AAQ4FPI7_AMBAM
MNSSPLRDGGLPVVGLCQINDVIKSHKQRYLVPLRKIAGRQGEMQILSSCALYVIWLDWKSSTAFEEEAHHSALCPS